MQSTERLATARLGTSAKDCRVVKEDENRKITSSRSSLTPQGIQDQPQLYGLRLLIITKKGRHGRVLTGGLREMRDG